MFKKAEKLIYWLPRFLGLAFIIFLTLLSLDIFDMGLGFWQTLLGLLIHNIPSIILALVLWIAWKHELFGAIIFISVGLLYIIMINAPKDDWFTTLTWYLTIAGPAFLIGGLLLIGWVKKRQ